MRKREVERYRRQLEAQLAQVLAQEEHAAEDIAGPDEEELPDPTDRATVEEVRSKNLRMHDRERRLEGKIRAALVRLDAGTFGRCTSCGATIPPERLRARPVTDVCVSCKAEAESKERRAGL